MHRKARRSMGTLRAKLLYTIFFEFSLPLNCFHTDYLAQTEWTKPYPRIVPAPCVCMIIMALIALHMNVQGWLGASISGLSIVQLKHLIIGEFKQCAHFRTSRTSLAIIGMQASCGPPFYLRLKRRVNLLALYHGYNDSKNYAYDPFPIRQLISDQKNRINVISFLVVEPSLHGLPHIPFQVSGECSISLIFDFVY